MASDSPLTRTASPALGFAVPSWGLYASSPRRDLIPSVNQRVASLFAIGLGGRLLTNANVQQSGVSRQPSYRSSSSSFDDEADINSPHKQIDVYLRKRGVFELLEINLVVEGFICNKGTDGVTVNVEKVFKVEFDQTKKKSRSVKETVLDSLRELQIEGQCPISEISERDPLAVPIQDLLEQFPLGAQVKALVISVDHHRDILYLSFNTSRLLQRQLHHAPLGIIASSVSNSLIPPASPFHHWRKSAWFNHPSQALQDIATRPLSVPNSLPASSSSGRATFVERLKEHPLFKNPHGLTLMTKAFGITEHGSLLPAAPCDPSDLHYNLRAVQNQGWALKSVAKGDEFAQVDRLQEAIRHYTYALDVEPQCTDAYVSRGVAFIRLNQFDAAIKDLTHALDIEPNHAKAATNLAIAHKQKSELEEDSDDYDDDVADQSSDDSDSVPSKKSRPDLSGDL
ncbi:S1 motif domain-containing protein [Plasmodiophora brassicae]